MAFLTELFAFAKSRKKLWLIPMILVFAIFGALFVLAQGSILAPFIYTLF